MGSAASAAQAAAAQIDHDLRVQRGFLRKHEAECAALMNELKIGMQQGNAAAAIKRQGKFLIQARQRQRQTEDCIQQLLNAQNMAQRARQTRAQFDALQSTAAALRQTNGALNPRDFSKNTRELALQSEKLRDRQERMDDAMQTMNDGADDDIEMDVGETIARLQAEFGLDATRFLLAAPAGAVQPAPVSDDERAILAMAALTVAR